ncbi:hypothetical protein CkaCkLH20_05913 [Colletotrichum karsti]|uniref:Uncharacterized protein n=1 Tax=Colletotrichum karsti TaxID=1095194 RepID=A0A9P6ID68_9PEZI|nr:uncharacterized protein CkaCkLH20_05913 [Colletotrichum karsti]KAF9876505.1 hypothetical protein CkaCkLH20_05913 [Colletotrichum karsti]
MQPVTYLGMLFFISASALAAPHHHHNHLQRHRDRVATHAHIKHDHAMLAKRAEQIRVDSSKAAQAETQDWSAEKQPRQSPSEEGPIVTLWEQTTGPKTAAAGAEEVVIRSSEPMAVRGEAYGRSKVAAHGDVGLEHAVEGLDSRHMNAATRLLLAHAARKHH